MWARFEIPGSTTLETTRQLGLKMHTERTSINVSCFTWTSCGRNCKTRAAVLWEIQQMWERVRLERLGKVSKLCSVCVCVCECVCVCVCVWVCVCLTKEWFIALHALGFHSYLRVRGRDQLACRNLHQCRISSHITFDNPGRWQDQWWECYGKMIQECSNNLSII